MRNLFLFIQYTYQALINLCLNLSFNFLFIDYDDDGGGCGDDDQSCHLKCLFNFVPSQLK